MTQIAPSPHLGLVVSLVWSLLYSLGQGGILSVALAAGLKVTARGPAKRSYTLCCAVLMSMVLCPCITLLWLRFGGDRPLSAASIGLPYYGHREYSGSVFAGGILGGNWLITEVNRHTRAILQIWVVGVLFLLGRLVVGLIGAKLLQEQSCKNVPEHLARTLRELSKRFDLERTIKLAVSAAISTPVVVGCFKPLILFPRSLLVTAAPENLEAVLAHEIAHVQRRDYLVNILQSVVEALLFFHPGVWWVSRQIRREREHCCDDIAVAVSGSALIYARALVKLEEERSPAQSQLLLGASGGHLTMRITRLFKQRLATSTRGTSFALVTLATLTILTVGGLSLSATEKVRAQTIDLSPDMLSLGLDDAKKNSPPDMSCTFYDRKDHPHPGVCEVPSQTEGPFFCKQADDTKSKQLQVGCEWKVQRYKEWQSMQSGAK